MPNSHPSSLTLTRATKIFSPLVSHLDVARSYLKVELTQALQLYDSALIAIANASIDALAEEQVWRLLEALSYTYRMNGVFHSVTNGGLSWTEIELPIDTITLTGTKPHINDIVYSESINRQPRAFAQYLRSYFEAHSNPHDDPHDLNEFRPRTNEAILMSSPIMTVERKGRIDMLNGTHRLIAGALHGDETVRAYGGIPNGKPLLSMAGDSVFLTLRLLYEKTEPIKQRAHIIETTTLLALASTDGAQAIRTYWTTHPRSQSIQSAGEEILKRIQPDDSLKHV